MPDSTARLGDNPTKDPLAGNERIAATDPSTDSDVCLTPDILTVYAQENMGLANGSSQGAMSGPQADKLDALPTAAELESTHTQLGQFPFPIFIPNPVDGFVEIFRNVLDNDIVWDFCWFALSSGSTILTLYIDGDPIVGWSNMPITTESSGATATSNKTLAPGSILGIGFAGSAAPENLRLTLKGDITLTP